MGAAPWLLLAGFAAALWPHWRWAEARLTDGSDDPLGLTALAVLLLAVARMAPRLRRTPSRAWLITGLLLTVSATALTQVAPPLLAALVAALAMAAALAAFAPARTPLLPMAGLAALALPVVSSLQFYAGFPLRVLTAEVSTNLLRLAGFAASRQGSSMQVDGHLVIVDAPCSGVQMVWMAYFCACTVACWRGLPDKTFIKRLAFVGAFVLAGNVLRNSALVALEARGWPASSALHEAIGLGVLASVCAAVVWLIGRPWAASPPVSGSPGLLASLLSSSSSSAVNAGRDGARQPEHGVSRRTSSPGRGTWATAAVLCGCAMAPLLATGPSVSAAAQTTATEVSRELPREWQGKPLRPLALGPVEARFAAHFPGRIERLTDERNVLVWREVQKPTRMLHPAADCYRGLGFRIDDARLERDAEARLWRCFVAVRDGRRIRVCERIEDANGLAFTDTSAWFWAAALGRSSGPWQAITVATPIGGAS